MPQLLDLGALRFVWRGTYSSATTYNVNDVVRFNANIYVCIVQNTLNSAPADASPWALMVPGAGGKVIASSATDTPQMATAAAGQTADLSQWLNSAGTVMGRVTPTGRIVSRGAQVTTFVTDTAANSYRTLSATVKSPDGTVTYATTTFGYDGTTGNLTTITEVAEGWTYTKTLAYDANGNLTTQTETAVKN